MTIDYKRVKHSQRDAESNAVANVKPRELRWAGDTKRWIGALHDGSVVKEGGESVRFLERFATVAAALTAFGASNIHCILTDAVTLTADATFPANVTLEVRKGGSIDLNGFTLTFTSQPVAGAYQIFSGAGSVSGIKHVRPEWFSSITAMLTAIGSSVCTVLIEKEYTLTANMTFPSTASVDIRNGGTFALGGFILTFNGAFAAERYQIFSGSGSVEFGSTLIVPGVPQWWGAKGDGVTDDTAAIQAAIDSLLGADGGTLLFPIGEYLITDTLNFGIWSISAETGNVNGFARTKTGIKVIGERMVSDPASPFTCCIKWGGDLQAGTTVESKSDSEGSYDFITDAAPMIRTVGGRGFFFSGISLEGDDKAHVGIEFEGNFFNAQVEKCSIRNCLIGVRIAKVIRHDTSATYFGYGGSPYYIANVYDAPSFGGFQADTVSIKHISFSGCKRSISAESAQCLSLLFENLWIAGAARDNWTSDIGILVRGGRVNLIGVGFGGTLTYAIRHLANTCMIEVQEGHDESNSTNTFRSSTTSGTGVRYSAHGGDTNKIELAAGDGFLSLSNIKVSDGGVKRASDSSASQVCAITMRNVEFQGDSGRALDLGTVADKTNVLVDVSNILCPDMTFTNDWGDFTGQIRSIVPEQLYTEYDGGALLDQWKSKKADSLLESTGLGLRFAGRKTGIEDETATVFCKFTPTTSNFYKITMNVLLQTGPSTNNAVIAETISFIIGKDSGGTLKMSSVEVVNSFNYLSGFASATATFTLAASGSDIELSVEQDNESSDSNMAITYEGTIIGGFNGGQTGLTTFGAL